MSPLGKLTLTSCPGKWMSRGREVIEYLSLIGIKAATKAHLYSRVGRDQVSFRCLPVPAIITLSHVVSWCHWDRKWREKLSIGDTEINKIWTNSKKPMQWLGFLIFSLNQRFNIFWFCSVHSMFYIKYNHVKVQLQRLVKRQGEKSSRHQNAHK